MELANEVLIKLISVECATIPFGLTVSQSGIVVDQSGQIAFPENTCSRFLYTHPNWLELVDDGLLEVRSYNDTAARLELTERGREYLDNIPAAIKINVLIHSHLRVLESVPTKRIVKLCSIYMQQLTLEELPVFLSSNNPFVRDTATERFDELRGGA